MRRSCSLAHSTLGRGLSATACLATTLLLSAVGCTTRSQEFQGYGNDQLWTAMVATARSPVYDDWKVSDNQVFLDDGSRRIEIYRVLKRTYVTPWSDPEREVVEWRFQVVLSHEDEFETPLVDFTARQIAVPAHVWNEADRYFAQMRSFLGPMKNAAEPAAIEEVSPMPQPLDEPLGSDAPASAPAAEPAPAIESGSAAVPPPTAVPPAEPLPE